MFDDVRLPDDIEQGARGGPGFRTGVVTLTSGREQRNQNWQLARGEWDIGYGVRRKSQMEGIYNFFMARRGMLRGFRFKDWFDYQMEAEPVGIVPNDPVRRQIVKTYPDPISPYTKPIVLPVIDTLVVYVNGVATTDYTHIGNGQLIFNTDPGPNVHVSCEFDIPVRFATDDLLTTLIHFDAGSQPSITLVELKPDTTPIYVGVSFEAKAELTFEAEADMLVEAAPIGVLIDTLVFVAGSSFETIGYSGSFNIGSLVTQFDNYVTYNCRTQFLDNFHIDFDGPGREAEFAGRMLEIVGVGTYAFDDATFWDSGGFGDSQFSWPWTQELFIPNQQYTVNLYGPPDGPPADEGAVMTVGFNSSSGQRYGFDKEALMFGALDGEPMAGEECLRFYYDVNGGGVEIHIAGDVTSKLSENTKVFVDDVLIFDLANEEAYFNYASWLVPPRTQIMCFFIPNPFIYDTDQLVRIETSASEGATLLAGVGQSGSDTNVGYISDVIWSPDGFGSIVGSVNPDLNILALYWRSDYQEIEIIIDGAVLSEIGDFVLMIDDTAYPVSENTWADESGGWTTVNWDAEFALVGNEEYIVYFGPV